MLEPELLPLRALEQALLQRRVERPYGEHYSSPVSTTAITLGHIIGHMESTNYQSSVKLCGCFCLPLAANYRRGNVTAASPEPCKAGIQFPRL